MADNLGISFRISAIDDFSATMANLQQSTKKAFESIGTIGKTLTGLGVAGAAGFGLAVNKAADFEQQMSKVAALAGATGNQFDQLRDKALDLGAKTSKSASEAAIGMQNLAAKGFDVNSIMAAMPGIISAAEASGEDMATTADVVASALNSWHMKASQASNVADVLAMAANKSSASITDMGYAFKYAAPVANTLGINMNELAAATGIMTDSGLAGEQAGTTLRMALLRLVDPSESAAKSMKKIGFSATDSQGNFKSLSQIIGGLKSSLEGLTQAQKAAYLSQMFGAEAVSGMMALMDAGQPKFDKFVATLDKSKGSAQATAQVMKNNFKGALDNMSGSIETAVISIGSALLPALRFLANTIATLTNKFNSLPDSVKSTIAIAGAAATAFALLTGPLLILVSLIPSITVGLGALAGLFEITVAALLSGIAVALGVVAAIIAVGAAFYIAYQKIAWFRNAVNAAWEWIKGAFNTALIFISGIVKSVMSAVSAFIGGELNKIKAFWDQNGAQITAAVKNVWSFISTYLKSVMDRILKVFSRLYGRLIRNCKNRLGRS
jgi:TP901 family phage tail tape measure protein